MCGYATVRAAGRELALQQVRVEEIAADDRDLLAALLVHIFGARPEDLDRVVDVVRRRVVRLQGRDINRHHFCYYSDFSFAGASHRRLIATAIQYGVRELAIIALFIKRIELGSQLLIADVLHVYEAIIYMTLSYSCRGRREVGAPRFRVTGCGRRRGAVVADPASVSLAHLCSSTPLTVETF